MITTHKEFWEVFKKTNGALSCCEAIAIIKISEEAPEGLFLECGTHKGKSALAACEGLQNGTFYLLDPIFEDKSIEDEVIDTVGDFADWGNIELILDSSYSTDFISKHNNYCYVFVDSGSHQDGLPMMEVKLLEDRVVQGGIIAFHDFRSQFVEVEQAYNYLLGTGKYEEIKIDWDAIVNYARENDLEKGNNSWHHNELDFPCFVGALKRK